MSEVLKPKSFNSAKTSVEKNINAKHFDVRMINVTFSKHCSDNRKTSPKFRFGILK